MENINNKSAIILAAGDGTRMKSRSSKVLCKVLGKEMISWVLSACEDIAKENICAVVSSHHSDVSAFLPEEICRQVQDQRLGTGHAVKCAREFIASHEDGDILILCGDAPFMDKETIEAAYAHHKKEDNTITLISAKVENPYGYGRIIYDDGKFTAIVEESECNDTLAQIKEVNSGTYWFKGSELLNLLDKIQNNNIKGEYYLTDTISIAVAEGKSTGVYTAKKPNVVLGANTRKALAELGEIARMAVIDKHYEAGVDIPNTHGVIISPEAVIGSDTTIMPSVVITGKTIIGKGCEIGLGTVIHNSVIGDDTVIKQSYITDSQVGDNVNMGPFVQLRPKSVIANGAKIGNFVEIKSSYIGENTSIAHLSYFGDSQVGSYVNVGCGVVTANYDGKDKHLTVVEDSAFIGCNTNLIAPVTVGKGANIAAGSTITKDVPAYSLAIERGTQANIENWSKTKGKYKKGL